MTKMVLDREGSRHEDEELCRILATRNGANGE